MPLRIMMVDDEPEVVKLFTELVKTWGYEIVGYSDSLGAASHVNREKFDGFFVDGQMPGLDGFSLTKIIRSSSSNSKAPIVMVTGQDDVETMREAFRSGITFFIGKPFSLEKLRSLLQVMRVGMLQEKRRYARLPLHTIVDCLFGNNRLKGESRNLSQGGMLLTARGQTEMGQEVGLEFLLPGSTLPLTLSSKVVWKENPDRVAVQFVEASRQVREAIAGYIGSLVSGA